MNVKRERDDCRVRLEESGAKASEGKQVYTNKGTHCRVSMIVRLLGNGEVAIADFTENVVREYLRTHRGELNRVLNVVSKVKL